MRIRKSDAVVALMAAAVAVIVVYSAAADVELNAWCGVAAPCDYVATCTGPGDCHSCNDAFSRDKCNFSPFGEQCWTNTDRDGCGLFLEGVCIQLGGSWVCSQLAIFGEYCERKTCATGTPAWGN